MRTRILSLFLVLSSATTAAAQGGWKEIGKTSAGNSVYVDPRSLRKSNGIVSARIRVKFAEPVSTPRGSWKTSQHLALFNCAKSTVAAKQSTYFSDEAGTHVVERTTIAQPGFGPALGGSMAKVALDYVCKT
jgi:hypothetical protein